MVAVLRSIREDALLVILEGYLHVFIDSIYQQQDKSRCLCTGLSRGCVLSDRLRAERDCQTIVTFASSVATCQVERHVASLVHYLCVDSGRSSNNSDFSGLDLGMKLIPKPNVPKES